MQTFLPYADYSKSAAVLDRARLGKQRVEVLQLVRVLAGVTSGWSNHPAALMWSGHEAALVQYGLCVCREWRARGYKDNVTERLEFWRMEYTGRAVKPVWFGSRRFHVAHRSNLLRKNPAHYRKYWPRLRDDLPYVWPVRKGAQ